MRNGQKIKVKKEDDYFTAYAKDEVDIEQIKSLPGVKEVEPIQNNILKVNVKPGQLDKAMEMYRLETDQHIAHHAYTPINSSETRYYITDTIAVKFKEGTPKERIEKILEDTKVEIVKEYRDSDNTFTIKVTKASGMNPVKLSNMLSEMEEVEFAEPDLINRFVTFYEPMDDLFKDQWHLKSWNGPHLVVNADVSSTEAWDITRGERSVVVAVIDDGCDLDHPDFVGENKIIYPKDYVDGDSNPFPVSGVGNYHGTPCAGVAIAEENGQGTVGIAPGCSFMPIRFDVKRTRDTVLREIFDYVGRYADVISCSWGPPPRYAPLNSLLSNKIQQLARNGGPRGKGCVIVFAAGNYNCPLYDPVGNTSYRFRRDDQIYSTNDAILNGNATHPDVIAVSSSTSINKKALYSNWGNEIAVCAPSNNFHPLDSSAQMIGRGIFTTDNETYGLGFNQNSIYTNRFGGTSSACPLVAGIAALIISANPNLTAKEVKEIIQDTADKIVDNDIDPILNVNKGTYNQNGHSEWFGYGKINAAKAVRKAQN
jgi:subtilisin family serine protease